VDSKRLDAQAGHEFTLTAIVPALAGANLMYGVGMLDSALTWDYASAFLQNEFIDMILKVVDGIQVSDSSLAMEVIREVGPGGEFVTHPHTYKHCRSLSSPRLMHRDTREHWEAAGCPDIAELAYERALALLEKERSPLRPTAVQEELERLYAEFDHRVRARKAEVGAA